MNEKDFLKQHRVNNISQQMKLYYKIRKDDVRLSIKEVEGVFYQTINYYVIYTKTLRYRMRMKKRPIKRKEILNRLNNR